MFLLNNKLNWNFEQKIFLKWIKICKQNYFLEKYCKDFIGRLGIPIYLHYLNPITNKTGYITDSETEATLKNCEIMEKMETILHASLKLRTNLIPVTDTTGEASTNEQTQAPCDSTKIKSHLPAPVFTLVSERSKNTFDTLREALKKRWNLGENPNGEGGPTRPQLFPTS